MRPVKLRLIKWDIELNNRAISFKIGIMVTLYLKVCHRQGSYVVAFTYSLKRIQKHSR